MKKKIIICLFALSVLTANCITVFAEEQEQDFDRNSPEYIQELLDNYHEGMIIPAEEIPDSWKPESEAPIKYERSKALSYYTFYHYDYDPPQLYKTSQYRHKDTPSSMYVENMGSGGYRARFRTQGQDYNDNMITGPIVVLNEGDSSYVDQMFFEWGYNTKVSLASANQYGVTHYISIRWSPDV